MWLSDESRDSLSVSRDLTHVTYTEGIVGLVVVNSLLHIFMLTVERWLTALLWLQAVILVNMDTKVHVSPSLS